MSLTSSGPTAAARSCACSGGTAAARSPRLAQSMTPSAGSPPGFGEASTGTRTTRLSQPSGPGGGGPLWMILALASAAAARSVARRSVPRNGPATIRARARLREITSSASGPVNRVLTGTSVAPAYSAPSAPSTQWWVLGDQMATASPGATPSAISARATTATCSCSWR